MGYFPSFLKPKPPPLDFQQTKANARPQHIEHQPSDVGFGDHQAGLPHDEQGLEIDPAGFTEFDEAFIAAEGEEKMNNFTYLLACAAGLS